MYFQGYELPISNKSQMNCFIFEEMYDWIRAMIATTTKMSIIHKMMIRRRKKNSPILFLSTLAH